MASYATSNIDMTYYLNLELLESSSKHFQKMLPKWIICVFLFAACVQVCRRLTLYFT